MPSVLTCCVAVVLLAQSEARDCSNGACAADDDAAAMLQTRSPLLRNSVSVCEEGDHVPCPGSGNMCAGNQCCPRTAESGGKTFPCPSAADSFAGCENNTKLSTCPPGGGTATTLAIGEEEGPPGGGTPTTLMVGEEESPPGEGTATTLMVGEEEGPPPAGCKEGDHVPCPGSGNMCAGSQCCPGTAESGGKTFPCPSAADSFAGCENNTKLGTCPPGGGTATTLAVGEEEGPPGGGTPTTLMVGEEESPPGEGTATTLMVGEEEGGPYGDHSDGW
ncbi:unnamed protein product [Prorocentrum cordatum]|uniref:Uncharacterized protein n=1 Tax=Prorocentrum cordatum TaxID=2364126 RepID=A0ABN9SZD5_9DINO|nr:unnamed protein product [Polarella glacialis]